MRNEIAGLPVLPNVVFQEKDGEKILRVFSDGIYVEVARTSGEVKRYKNILLLQKKSKGNFLAYFVNKDNCSFLDDLRVYAYAIADNCYICRCYDERGSYYGLTWVRQSLEDENDRKEIGDEIQGLNSELRAFFNKDTKILCYLDAEWYDDDDPDHLLDCDCISEGTKHSYLATQQVLKEVSCFSYCLKEEGADVTKIISGEEKKRFLEVTTVSGEIEKIYL